MKAVFSTFGYHSSSCACPFRLSNNELGASGCLALSPTLLTLTRLVTLKLARNKLRVEGVRQLVRTLPCMAFLEKLKYVCGGAKNHTTHTPQAHSCTRTLIHCLKAGGYRFPTGPAPLPTLPHELSTCCIRLGGNELGPEGATALTVLSSITSLKYLVCVMRSVTPVFLACFHPRTPTILYVCVFVSVLKFCVWLCLCVSPFRTFPFRLVDAQSGRQRYGLCWHHSIVRGSANAHQAGSAGVR